jgi:hypothetical protein
MFAKPFACLCLAAGLTALPSPAAAQDTPQAGPQEPSQVNGPSSNPDVADEYTQTEKHTLRKVKKALEEEQFAKLDEIAAELRALKSRTRGGEWVLQDFYSLVDSIGTTDADAQARIDLLHRWIAARPGSITPYVALGGVLHRWAWRARGGGSAETVTLDGWHLFHQRLAQAAQALTEGQNLHETCPHLYAEWLTVGLGQDWQPEKMRGVFEQAVKAEPGYVLDYQIYANYLQPKWDGQPGEASAFARSSADRIGGTDGDMIYFQIALILVHRGNPGLSAKEMDWARIQRGYSSTKERFGVTERQENRMAYMAWKFRDAEFARKQFQTIGEHWSKTVWRDQETYDKARAWAEARP